MKKMVLFAMMCLICPLLAGTAPAQDAGPEVTRAVFATGIEDREPVEIIMEYFPTENGVIFFFTELKNMDDTKVFHVWHKNGEEVYRFTSNVGGARWRTNSSMKAEHFKSGDEVIVEVVGPNDEVYASETLSIR